MKENRFFVKTMKDPKEELHKYFNILLNHFINIKMLDKQLRIIHDWEKQDKLETLQSAGLFFSYASQCISRIILIELLMFISGKEEKSLLDWLNKSKENANSIDIFRFNMEKRQSIKIKSDEYRNIVDNHISLLNENLDTLSKIKVRRDKVFAHRDKEYFNNPNKVDHDYPLKDCEIDKIFEDISTVLKDQHYYLFKTSISIDVDSHPTLNTLLIYAQGFKRFQKENNFRKL